MVTKTAASAALCAPATDPRKSAGTPKVISDARLRFDIKKAGAPSELEQRLSEALLKVQDRADRACDAIQAAIAALPNDTDADASRAVLELLESNSASLSSEVFDVAGMVLVAAQACAASGLGESKVDNAGKLRGLASDFEIGEIRLDGAFALMCWVERARATLDRMSDIMKVSPELARLVRECDISMDADWSEAASNGLIDLMSEASGTASHLFADGAAFARAAAKGAHHE
jgi:hypothetical protein